MGLGNIIKITVVLLALAGSIDGFCQLPAQGDVKDYIFNKIPSLPRSGGSDYQDPTDIDLGVWAQATNKLWNSEIAEAHTLFEQIGYRVIELTNLADNKVYHVVEKSPTGENYWGIYVFNLKACRPQLVIQSPHPVFDSNTGYQGMYSFLELDAGAFFLSGTHRCNNVVESECSGSTSVCGASGPYKISDPAHNADGVFQRLTGMMLARIPLSVFIQFHGFGKQDGDPNAILSNGSRSTPETDYITDLIAEMNVENPNYTFRVAHKDLSWDRLVAFTNTQGRLINRSANACSSGVSVSNGQFIHIEQERDEFRNDLSGWSKWIGPMSRVFECVEVEKEILAYSDEKGFGAFPNPFSERVSFRMRDINSTLNVFNAAGQLVYSRTPGNWSDVDLSFLECGLYTFQINSENRKSVHSGRLIKE